jgi:hypothetical protein
VIRLFLKCVWEYEWRLLLGPLLGPQGHGLVQAKREDRFRGDLDVVSFCEHLCSCAAGRANQAANRRAFPPPAMAPMIEPTAAPPPIVAAVRVFVPMPVSLSRVRSVVLTRYFRPSSVIDWIEEQLGAAADAARRDVADHQLSARDGGDDHAAGCVRHLSLDNGREG